MSALQTLKDRLEAKEVGQGRLRQTRTNNIVVIFVY